MIQNYLRVAIRNLVRQRLYSLINATGLAVGVATCVIVLLFIQHELQYDRHYTDVDQIHRVIRERNPGGNHFQPLGLQGPVGPALAEEIPGIVSMTRFFKRQMWAGNPDRGFDVLGAVSDDHLLTFFDFKILEGDGPDALGRSDVVFITRSFAKKMYPRVDPIGRMLSINYKWIKGDFQVAGILADQPATTSGELKFDIVVNRTAMGGFYQGDYYKKQLWDDWLPDTNFLIVKTFVRLRDETRLEDLRPKLAEFARRHLGDEIGERDPYHIFPLTRLHLYASGDYGLTQEPWDEPLGNVGKCYAFALVGLFILSIASINFVNLSTASASKRATEVGIRKAIGATQTQLRSQFIGEAVVLSLAVAVLSLAVTSLALPFVNGLIGRPLESGYWASAFAVLIALSVGFLAGTYPAFFLSSLNAVHVLRGSGKRPSASNRLREALVVFQFAVSVVLIIATIVTHRQTNLIHLKDLGFTREGQILVPLFRADTSLRSRSTAIRNRFSQHPSVEAVGAGMWPPGRESQVTRAMVHRAAFADSLRIYFTHVDENYQDVYQIPLLSGRKFVASDVANFRLLLNRKAAESFDPPVEPGATVSILRSDWEVVGIIENYHNATLHHPIRPAMLTCQNFPNYLNIRVKTDNLPETIAFLREAWLEFLPNRSFESQFVDEYLAALYRSETRMKQAYTALSGLAIFVACLGLLGLISYTTEARTKEIGIRKAIGSTSAAIVRLLLTDFAKLISLASLIACPVAYLIAREWLAGFAYRVDLGPDVFLLGGLTALGIAVLTIAGQAAKAAMRAPSESLRSE